MVIQLIICNISFGISMSVIFAVSKSILISLTFFTGKVDRFPEMVDLITGKVDFVLERLTLYKTHAHRSNCPPETGATRSEAPEGVDKNRSVFTFISSPSLIKLKQSRFRSLS